MCQIPFQVLSEVSHFILPARLVGSDFFLFHFAEEETYDR